MEEDPLDIDQLDLRNHINRGRALIQDILKEPADIVQRFCDSDSEDETPIKSERNRRPNKERNHVLFHEKLMEDYFNLKTADNDEDFCRRYQMEHIWL